MSGPFFIPFERGINPVAETAVGAGEGVDAVHLLGGELEVEDVEVFRGAGFLRRARDGDDVLLDQPAQGDLTGRFAVGLADLDQGRIVGDLALGERRPCGDRRFELSRRRLELRELEVGVILDLVGDEFRRGERLRPAEFGRGEVGDADGPGQALGLRLVQGAERFFQRRLGLGPVQQQQVRREAEAGGALAGLGQQTLAVEIGDPDLGGQPDLVAGDVPGLDGVADAIPDRRLVSVMGGSCR